MKVICIYTLHDSLDTGLGLICFGLSLKKIFGLASHFLASASPYSGLINKPGYIGPTCRVSQTSLRSL